MSVFDYDGNCAKTMAAIRDPQVGDRFHEMFSFWRYVVARFGERVIVMDGSPPCTLPDDGRLHEFATVAEYVEAMTYPTMRDKSPMMLSDRGNDVSGWYAPEVTGVTAEWLTT